MYAFVSAIISCSHTKRSHVHHVLSNKQAVLPCGPVKKYARAAYPKALAFSESPKRAASV